MPRRLGATGLDLVVRAPIGAAVDAAAGGGARLQALLIRALAFRRRLTAVHADPSCESPGHHDQNDFPRHRSLPLLLVASP